MSSVSFQVPVGQRQLFLDDVGIAVIDGLTRTMHQPRKLGAVIRPDCSVGVSSHQTRTAPVWDPDEKVSKMRWKVNVGSRYWMRMASCWQNLFLYQAIWRKARLAGSEMDLHLSIIRS